MKRDNNHWYWFVFVCVLLADQVSKAQIVKHLPLGRVTEITDFFNLVHFTNRGITFGLFSKVMPWIFIVSALAIIHFLIMYGKDHVSQRLQIGMITSGAIGNVIDRVHRGAVVDFLDFHWKDWHWPAFNIADSAIVIGVFWLIVLFYLEGKNREINSEEEQE